jgi:hypothetical protein
MRKKQLESGNSGLYWIAGSVSISINTVFKEASATGRQGPFFGKKPLTRPFIRKKPVGKALEHGYKGLLAV